MDCKRISGMVNKKIELAGEIFVVSITEDPDIESARDRLYIATKHGMQELDSSIRYINLQSATLDGREVVVKWTTNKADMLVRCERRIPIP